MAYFCQGFMRGYGFFFFGDDDIKKFLRHSDLFVFGDLRRTEDNYGVWKNSSALSPHNFPFMSCFSGVCFLKKNIYITVIFGFTNMYMEFLNI